MGHTAPSSLKDVSTHFQFGENWDSYSRLLDDQRIDQAARDLSRFLGVSDLTGQRFLDIGSGSGLHSLAAFLLGAEHVTAIDLDPSSVATTHRVLSKYMPGRDFDCRQLSVFDATTAELGQFDIVYSWGVLHHTGAMHEAIESASRLVADNGLLALALYRETVLCNFWKVEKRLYSKMPAWLQALLVKAYSAKSQLGFVLKGRDFRQYLAEYKQQRGMDYEHDIHDLSLIHI